MREMVLNNIRSECRNHIRNGKALPTRDPRWFFEIERIMSEELKIFQVEQEQEIKLMYDNYHKKHVSGISYEEWLEKAKKLYKVNGYWVASIARGPNFEKEWGPFKTEKQAHKKLLELLGNKNYDHFVREYDFAYDPDKKD